MTTCPHCGKRIETIDAVKHWRENTVVLPGEKTQLVSVLQLPDYHQRSKKPRMRGSWQSPVFVTVEIVK